MGESQARDEAAFRITAAWPFDAGIAPSSFELVRDRASTCGLDIDAITD